MSGEVRYGVWSTWSHKWCFGINEPSKRKAFRALQNKVGKDAYRYRFKIKKISQEQLKSDFGYREVEE